MHGATDVVGVNPHPDNVADWNVGLVNGGCMQIECRSPSQIRDDDIVDTLDAVEAELNDMVRGGPRFGAVLARWRLKRERLLKLKADLEAAVVGDVDVVAGRWQQSYWMRYVWALNT